MFQHRNDSRSSSSTSTDSALPAVGRRTLTGAHRMRARVSDGDAPDLGREAAADGMAHGALDRLGADGPVLERMGAAFGHDFGEVRIHEGANLHHEGARAYAAGSDVSFAAGQYDPSSRGGLELIAHELAHVVQQRTGGEATDYAWTPAYTSVKKAGFHEDKDGSVSSKNKKLPLGTRLTVDPAKKHGEFVEAILEDGTIGYIKLRKVTLDQPAEAVDPAFAARGGDMTHASGQIEAEDEEGAVAEQGAFASKSAMADFTTREDSGGARSQLTSALDTAGAVTSLGTSKMIDKAVGQNLKAALPLSVPSKVKIKLGQTARLVGALPGTLIPVVGEIIGAPLTALGVGLESSGQGMTAGQSIGKGLATAGAGMATGAIPVVGQVDGAVGLASAADALFSGFDSPTKLATVEKLKGIKASLDAAQTEAGDELDLMSVAGYAEAYRTIDHYIEKYEALIAKKEDAGAAGLLKYAAPSV